MKTLSRNDRELLAEVQGPLQQIAKTLPEHRQPGALITLCDWREEKIYRQIK